MARDKTIKILRTTRANLNTQKTASGLLAGEPYLITDEGRLAIGTAVNDYADMAKKSEVDAKKTDNVSATSRILGRKTAGSGAIEELTVDEVLAFLSDNTTNDVSTSKHGLVPKLPNDATKFLDGAGAFDTVKDSDLSLSDITTNNASSTKHGFCPKLPNNTTTFLRGDGTFAAPSGGGGALELISKVSFSTNTTSVEWTSLTADKFLLLISNLCANSDTKLYIEFGNSGTFRNHISAIYEIPTNSTTITRQGSNTGVGYLHNRIGQSSSPAFSYASVIIQNMTKSVPTYYSMQGFGYRSSPSYNLWGGGSTTSEAADNQIRITSDATFTQGELILYKFNES